ncbi:MAG: tRNA (guanosine(37)-N1)-methyltransferase TrmD [Flavobacteriales bacterium]|nr:tRNA (guanosine(37)-N1)-methyltransferase TrmD [Flavobacteriales bacterium]
MRIDIITIFPDLLHGPFQESIIKRAHQKGLAEIHIHDLRAFSQDKHRRVDDYPYGGGAGMVMTIDPIYRCIQSLRSERDYDEVIFMTPDGITLDQSLCNTLSTRQNLIILCGHYKGIDQRIRDHLITMEISIGDYVLSGGELAAAVLCDSVIRLIPGVLGDETSALSDSFQDGLLAPPVYTRPENYEGWVVPEVLLSGHEARIEEWRHEKAVERTTNRRPDLIENLKNDDHSQH